MTGFIPSELVNFWPAILGGFVVLFHFVSRFFNERQARKKGREEGAREVIDQIQEQTDERIERAEEARRTTEQLNADSLRELAAKSRNNRGRVQRP